MAEDPVTDEKSLFNIKVLSFCVDILEQAE